MDCYVREWRGGTVQDRLGITLASNGLRWRMSARTLLRDLPVTQMPDVPQLRVLVIDDTVDNAEALCILLRAMGCLTAVAFSGTQGITAAAGFDPHLAFIDLEMPGMGGCEVAGHLRASDPEGTARLICLTGRGQPDDRRTCMDAGFDAHSAEYGDQESEPCCEQSVHAQRQLVGSGISGDNEVR